VKIEITIKNYIKIQADNLLHNKTVNSEKDRKNATSATSHVAHVVRVVCGFVAFDMTGHKLVCQQIVQEASA